MARKMSEGRIAQILEQEITLSEGGEYGQDSLMQNRRQAWQYYLGRPRGDEDPDKSQVQSLDVADQVEHLMAQIMPAFCNDNPAEFEPENPNDTISVEAESQAVNRIIMEDNDGYSMLYLAVKDALLFKNGFIKVYVEEATETETVVFDDLEDGDAALLAASLPEGIDVEPGDGKTTVTRKRDRKHLRCEAVEPATMHYQKNWWKLDFQDIRFIGERRFMMRSEMLGNGWPKGKVDRLPAHTMDTKSDSYTKNLEANTGALQATHKSSDIIEVWECYMLLPVNLNPNATESERYRIFMSNRKILDIEQVSIVPYITATPFIVPHRVAGLSIFDKLKEIQDCKTAGLRQWTDNMSHINNARLFIKGDVNREELGISAPGRHVTGGFDAEMVPIPVQDFGPSATSYLNYMDRVRSERGGAAIDLGSAEGQLTKSSIGATGVAMVMGAQEQMASFITRTFAETLIRPLFLLVHRVAREVWRQPMMLRQADKWNQVNPATWRPRTRVNVKTGLAPGERGRRKLDLEKVMQAQLQLYAGGESDTMVSRRELWTGFMNWAKAAELDNPEQYLVHYASDASRQAAQGKAQQGQMQMQMGAQMQTLPEQVKMAIARMEDKTKRDLGVLDAEVEEMKVVGSAAADLAREQRNVASGGQGEGSPGTNGGNQPPGAS